MTLIIAYVALILAQISIYFYLKNDLRSIAFLGKINQLMSFESTKDQEETLKAVKIEKAVPLIKVSKKEACTDQLLLDKSLKHLEFIAQFESYLESKHSEKFSLEFLQEFESIKREAQINTIRTSQQLNSAMATAA